MDKKDAELAIVPAPGPAPEPGKADQGPATEAVEKIKAAEAAKLQRRLTDALKAGMVDALKKVSAQIAHSTDLNFQALRGTSVQKHPEGQDLVVVVDVIPKVFHDGSIQVGS